MNDKFIFNRIIVFFWQGDKIHATVKQELASQFEQRLTQGASKILINFSLNHSCGSYRTTHHAYKIGFLSTTRVKVCEDLPKELSGLQPVKFGDLLDGSLNTDFLVGEFFILRWLNYRMKYVFLIHFYGVYVQISLGKLLKFLLLKLLLSTGKKHKRYLWNYVTLSKYLYICHFICDDFSSSFW